MTPRPDLIRIEDIIASIKKIEEYKDSLYLYEHDEYIRYVFFDAILYNLVIIGEAVRSLSNSTKAQFRFNQWAKVVGLRNNLVHRYAAIDRNLVLEILNEGLIDLKNALQG